jgi:hypothetical protein
LKKHAFKERQKEDVIDDDATDSEDEMEILEAR